ncbi:hypothetical protein AAMO2058_001652600 [Amorphochlora amoebiformis]
MPSTGLRSFRLHSRRSDTLKSGSDTLKSVSDAVKEVMSMDDTYLESTVESWTRARTSRTTSEAA